MARPSSAARSIRRITSGAALVLFPALLAVEGPVDPAEGGTGAVVYRAATEHAAALTAAGLMLLSSGVLMAPAIAGLVHQARDRGAALSNAGAVLGVLGGAGHISLGIVYLFVLAMAGGDRAQMEAFFDRVGSNAVFVSVAFPLLLCFGLGLVFLAWGAWRSGSIGIWGPVVTTAVVLAHLVLPEGLHVVEEAALLALVAVFGSLGVRVLRMTPAEWDGRRPATPARTPVTA